MPEIVRARNVSEAVEIADGFKSEGRCNWFRGQVRVWPPYSSLFRVRQSKDEERILRAQERFYRYAQFLEETPGLEPILNDRDAVFAVAQHYGIPTDYLDFTTEPSVAGFFACDTTERLDDGTESCIYCLDTKELKRVWQVYAKAMNYPEPDFIISQPPNLWRLEAQHGVFLYCPTNWEVVYPMDRIVFPYKGYPAYPTEASIYPDQKSHLETLLYQHFGGVHSTDGALEMEKALIKMAAAGANVSSTEVRTTADGYFAQGVVGTVPMLESWNQQRLAPWLEIPVEAYAETAGGQIRLNAEMTKPPSELRDAFVFACRRVLQQDPNLRKRSIEFCLENGAHIDSTLQNALQWLWNGLRSLPFSGDDLAQGIGACVQLHRMKFSTASGIEDEQPIVNECFGPSICVEFGGKEGSVCRGWVSEADLSEAIRADIGDLIAPRYRDEACDVRQMMRIVFSPSRLFEFNKLARLFATQLAPTQVLENREAVFFSPARLRTFGLP